MIASQGRLGRSWGCPAVRPAIAKELIDAIKDGSLVVAYYPDADWLARSAFLEAPRTSADGGSELMTFNVGPVVCSSTGESVT